MKSRKALSSLLILLSIAAFAAMVSTVTPARAANFSLAFSDYPPGNIGCGVFQTTPNTFDFFVDYQSSQDFEWKASLVPQSSTPQGTFLDGSGSGTIQAGSGVNRKLSLVANLGNVPLLPPWTVTAAIDAYVDGVQVYHSNAVIGCAGEFGFQQYSITYEPIIQLTAPTGVRIRPTVSKPTQVGPVSDPQTDGSAGNPSCDVAKFIATTGLPYGPITMNWGPIPDATSYVAIIAIKGLQPHPEAIKTLSFVEVKAPDTQASFTVRKAGGDQNTAKTQATADLSMRKAGGDTQSIIGVIRNEDIDEVIRAHATFVLTVLARTDGKPLCVVTRFISTEPRPTSTPLPTSTPVPTTAPHSGNTSGNSSNTRPVVKPTVCASTRPCR